LLNQGFKFKTTCKKCRAEHVVKLGEVSSLKFTHHCGEEQETLERIKVDSLAESYGQLFDTIGNLAGFYFIGRDPLEFAKSDPKISKLVKEIQKTDSKSYPIFLSYKSDKTISRLGAIIEVKYENIYSSGSAEDNSGKSNHLSELKLIIHYFSDNTGIVINGIPYSNGVQSLPKEIKELSFFDKILISGMYEVFPTDFFEASCKDHPNFQTSKLRKIDTADATIGFDPNDLRAEFLIQWILILNKGKLDEFFASKAEEYTLKLNQIREQLQKIVDYKNKAVGLTSIVGPSLSFIVSSLVLFIFSSNEKTEANLSAARAASLMGPLAYVITGLRNLHIGRKTEEKQLDLRKTDRETSLLLNNLRTRNLAIESKVRQILYCPGCRAMFSPNDLQRILKRQLRENKPGCGINPNCKALLVNIQTN
jgi:hypothetical protein